MTEFSCSELIIAVLFFFFSSRRRHTRFKCDWSSDVCSSDLSYLKRLTPEVVSDMIPFIEQDAREVMSAFRGVARRVVAISSQDVYQAFGRVNGKESGPVDAVPITEDSPLRENLYPRRGETPRRQDDPRRWED